MKTIFAGICFLAVLFNFNSQKRNFHKGKNIYTEIIGDSGYIRKGEALRLLSQAKYDPGTEWEGRDTLDLEARIYKFSDTIGKYYRMDNGKYIALLCDIIHPDRNMFTLLEINDKGEVLQAEPYYAGMHQCCWERHYEGLKKYPGGYFGTKSCGTGSGFCSSYLYLFKDFSPQGNGISTYIYSGWCIGGEISCHLTSDMEIKNDTVTMHYTMEHLKERRNGKYKTVFSEKFDVKYVEREQGWVALDSTKIQEFPD
ncbi:hypothetical protein HYN59_09775 [Flavobacterium album]|uniref:Uncharacterized protein n=1 Tax=Flavobacterium album TaxID=2175091 RepID=A0A2S1QYA0_9FLAO|nr:hypothetical protein [Flavobacterium album]AWH85383.1 hypothetical protein HYN59_09775 [Flavobacterium album]